MSFKTANTSSVVDLRSATDEKLPIALETLGYSQSFTLVDTRLGLGVLSVVAAGLTFYAEKNLTFDQALPYTKLLLVLYFIISGAALFHAKFVEKSIVYQGTKKDQSKLEISGSIDKYVPEYKLNFKITSPKGSSVDFNTTLEFKDIFDRFGNLHESQLGSWVKKQLEANTKEN